MDLRLYGRITNICTIVVIGAVFTADMFSGLYHNILTGLMVAAALVLLTAFIYHQHLFKKPNETGSDTADPRETAKVWIKHAALEKRMTESDYITWTNGIWKDIVNELAEEDDNLE